MDLGAERAVLAGIFSYGLESYVEVCDIIDSDSFSHKNNQVIFKCIEKIIKDGAEIDLPSLLSAAKKLDLQDIINSTQELEYINSLMEYPIKKDNVLYFAAQIKKFEFARKIKKLTNKIGRDIDDINGDESIDEIINILENPNNLDNSNTWIIWTTRLFDQLSMLSLQASIFWIENSIIKIESWKLKLGNWI